MPLLVVAATGLELCAALGLERHAPQGEVFSATAHGREVLTLVTGIGVVNTALCLGRAIERHRPDGLVGLGVAGSFDMSAHPLGCVRLVERETWPEYGLLASGQIAADACGLGFAQWTEGGRQERGADGIFGELAWDAPAGLERLGLGGGRAWQTASSLTVSGVTADAERAEALRARFGAGLENMEGFALAYAARLAGLPVAQLRAVSNAVGARPPQAWDLPGALAALSQAAPRLLAP